MKKLFAKTDWVDWEVHEGRFTAEQEDKLAQTLQNMGKRMSIFSRAEFPTDFGLVVLTKLESEEKEPVFYHFELKGQYSTPRAEGVIHFY